LKHEEYGKLVKFFAKHDLQVAKKAINSIIEKKIDINDLVLFINKNKPLTAVITPDIIDDFETMVLADNAIDDKISKRVLEEIQGETLELKVQPTNDKNEFPLGIVELVTVTPILKTKGKVSDFFSHFTDRYTKLVKIFIDNNQVFYSKKQVPLISDFEHLIKIQEQARVKGNKSLEVVVVGYISEIQESRETITVYLQGLCNPPSIAGRFRKNTTGAKKAIELPLGVVVGINGIVTQHFQRNFPVIEARSIIYPDIISTKDDRKLPFLKDDPLLIAVSDLRFTQLGMAPNDGNCSGSQKSSSTFLDLLISSLNQTVTTGKQGRLAAIIFSGNIIDSTKSNFSVKDQYTSLIKRLSALNPSITIILTPGETDFTRKFFPQPRPHKKNLPELPLNIHFLDNPAFFSIKGRKILVFHDKNAQIVVKKDEEIDYLVKLLRYRYLAPKWQNTISVVLPAPSDPLIINQKPDVFILSSVNTTTTGRYKDTRLVTAMSLLKYVNGFDDPFTSGSLTINLPAINLNTLESRIMTLTLEQIDS
jgi:DNA polymerase II small subunit/DNA polymerase delta subunit B